MTTEGRPAPPAAPQGSASPGLKRQLGAGSAVLITVGAMVGSGIFATPHDVATQLASPLAMLALWLLGAALSLLGALSFAELGAAIPETGGMYLYLRRAYGPFAAFSFGWAMLAVLVPSSVAYFAQITADHVGSVFHASAGVQRALAVAMIAALTVANLLGTRAGVLVQDAATVVKCAGVLAIAALALLARPAAVAVSPAVPPRGGLGGAITALLAVLWAYDGWIDLTSVAGEVRAPEREVPRALVRGTLAVAALYLLVNAGYLRALGAAGLAASAHPALDAAGHALGAPGRAGASLVVAAATFGGCAVALLTGSRVVYAVARDGLFFRAFARASRRSVPDAAVAACGALAVLYEVSPVGKLGELFVLGAWPFYALGALATVVLRAREPALARPFRTPMYPWPIALFSASALAIVLGAAVADPRNSAVSLGLIALALPAYAVASWSRRRTHRA